MFFFSCSSSEQNNDASKDELSKKNVKSVAIEKYSENFSLVYNSTKEYVICINKSKTKIPNTGITNYFVYDIKHNSLIEENKIINGTISWYSDFEIKVLETPGMIQKNMSQENGYIFNIKTNSKTKINCEVH